MRHPGCGVQLDDERASVAVHHEAGKAIVFAVHQAVAGGVRRSQRGTPHRGGGQPGAEPVTGNGRGRPVLQHLHPNRRARVVQTRGEETAAFIEGHRDVTRMAFKRLGADGALIQPGVPLAQRARSRRCDAHSQATLRGRRNSRQQRRLCDRHANTSLGPGDGGKTGGFIQLPSRQRRRCAHTRRIARGR